MTFKEWLRRETNNYVSPVGDLARDCFNSGKEGACCRAVKPFTPVNFLRHIVYEHGAQYKYINAVFEANNNYLRDIGFDK